MISPLPLSDPRLHSPSIDARGAVDAGAELHEVAEQFEAIFLHQIFKQMRASQLAEGILSHESVKKYQQMHDYEQAQFLSQSVDLGIAKALIQQLQPLGQK